MAKRRYRSKVCLKSAISSKKKRFIPLDGDTLHHESKARAALRLVGFAADSTAKNKCARLGRARFPLSSTSVFAGGGNTIRHGDDSGFDLDRQGRE